jgi:hypothetical protein
MQITQIPRLFSKYLIIKTIFVLIGFCAITKMKLCFVLQHAHREVSHRTQPSAGQMTDNESSVNNTPFAQPAVKYSYLIRFS